MPPFGPIKRAELIRYFRQIGFTGPFPGKKHQIMQNGDITVGIPNPHQGDISKDLLNRILKQAGIDRADWEKYNMGVLFICVTLRSSVFLPLCHVD